MVACHDHPDTELEASGRVVVAGEIFELSTCPECGNQHREAVDGE